jgi:hypothetical protein
MKKSVTFSVVSIAALFVLIVQGCNFSTANISSFKSSADKEGKTETANFKAGEPIYARATVSNNPGKVKVKFSIVPEADKGDLKKGQSIKELETLQDIEGGGVAVYSFSPTAEFPAGTYKINADMIGDAGEKKDGKSVTVTVAE